MSFVVSARATTSMGALKFRRKAQEETSSLSQDLHVHRSPKAQEEVVA